MSHGTVLVVDDDKPIQEMLAEALTDEGYQVLTSVDGASVLVAHDTQPGVILLDLDMPRMGGVEVSKRLRADHATRHIPVITMSGKSQGWATPGLLADDWLGKPFRLNALYAVVAKWMPPDGCEVTR